MHRILPSAADGEDRLLPRLQLNLVELQAVVHDDACGRARAPMKWVRMVLRVSPSLPLSLSLSLTHFPPVCYQPVTGDALLFAVMAKRS